MTAPKTARDATCALLYGTMEAPRRPEAHQAGDLSLEIAGGSIRAIRWQGREIVRGIDFLIRDENWGTYAAEAAHAEVERDADGFVYRCRFMVGEGALACRLVVSAEASGVVEAVAEIAATRDFMTNRAGLTLLHPIAGLAGSPLTVDHGDRRETSRFPALVSPAQPVFDIAGLFYAVGDAAVDIAFSGEIFEMEDQRNWTDASFKTYCRPLSRPTPYRIAAGETVRQAVRIRVSGDGRPSAAGRAGGPATLSPTGEAMPEIALAIEDGWLPSGAAAADLAATGVRRLAVRVGPANAAATLAGVAVLPFARDAAIDLEIVLPDDREGARAALSAVARATAAAGITPSGVVALPAAYLKSYQPDGVWPAGLAPEAAIGLVREAFPGIAVGGGALTNFTEFNRRPPDRDACDFVTHGTTAIVHASDDRSVLETLEALPDVFRSARALGGDRPYRLGLVAIGMRSNPYGAAVAANPDQRRVTMAGVDPRQRGLFAAAWAVGAVAATSGGGVSSLALAGPAGPFGLVHRPESWPQPVFDADPAARLFPLFHVVRALARGGGRGRLAIAGLPDRVAGVAFAEEGGTRLVLANLSPDAVEVPFAAAGSARLLDVASVRDAAGDPHWLDRPGDPATGVLTLGAYAVAFVEAAGGAA